MRFKGWMLTVVRPRRLRLDAGVALLAMLAITPAAAQQPSNEIVRIRIGDACGMCSGKYSMSVTSIEGTRVTQTLIERGDEDTVRHRPKTERHRISQQDWDALRQSIDSTTLAGFVGTIGCPGCTDSSVEWAEVDFADGSKRSVEFDTGAGPPAVTKLIARVEALAPRY